MWAILHERVKCARCNYRTPGDYGRSNRISAIVASVNEWPGADALRKALTARGTSRRLAIEIGTDPSNVTRWKRGTWPDPALIPRIESALGLEPGSLSGVSQRDEVAELRALVIEQGRQLIELTQRVQDLDAGIAQLRRATGQGAAGSR